MCVGGRSLHFVRVAHAIATTTMFVYTPLSLCVAVARVPNLTKRSPIVAKLAQHSAVRRWRLQQLVAGREDERQKDVWHLEKRQGHHFKLTNQTFFVVAEAQQ